MENENLYTFENPEYRKTFWHTSSHVMAQAVKRLWPEVQLAIGPAIDEGWYYDFDAPFSFTPDHLSQIEAEMKKIVKERIRLERSEKSRQEAIARLFPPYCTINRRNFARTFYHIGSYEDQYTQQNRKYP